MVVGDSSSRTLGYGLERWSCGDRRGSRVECRDRRLRPRRRRRGRRARACGRGSRERCRYVQSEIAAQVAEFDPDVVVVLSDDLRPAATTARRLGRHASARRSRLRRVPRERVRGRVRRALVRRRPGRVDDEPVRRSDDRPVAERRTWRSARRAARRTRQRRSSRTSSRTCAPTSGSSTCTRCCAPTARMRTTAGGVDPLRIDGVHFTPDGSRWFARTYGTEILELGTG